MSAQTQRAPLRLLHTSDVHLGPGSTEANGRRHASGCFCPIEAMSRLIGERDVDVLLIVGDLFDHDRVSNAFADEVIGRLSALPVEVLLLPGNHDVHEESGLYNRRRETIARSNLHFFDEPGGQTIDVRDGALRVWARALDLHSPAFEPLAGAPPHPGDRWYVVAGHGHFSDGPDTYRSSPILAHEIEAPGADYVALGHWHYTTNLSERGVASAAWYSGAPVWYGSGQMLVVDLVPGAEVQVEPVLTADALPAVCAGAG